MKRLFWNGIFLVAAALLLIGCTDRQEGSRIDVTSHETALSGKVSVALRDSLLRNGLYDCCIKPGCDHCILKDGRCDCYENIRKSDPICGECLRGYKEGKGKLKLVSIPELEQIRKEKGTE